VAAHLQEMVDPNLVEQEILLRCLPHKETLEGIHQQVLLVLEVVVPEVLVAMAVQIHLQKLVDWEFNYLQHLEIHYPLLDSQDHREVIGLLVVAVVVDGMVLLVVLVEDLGALMLELVMVEILQIQPTVLLP
jgi:hypothetical protein